MNKIAFMVLALSMLMAMAEPGAAEVRTGLASIGASIGVYNGGGTSFGGFDTGGASFGISGNAEIGRINDNTTLDVGMLWFRDSSEFTQTLSTVPLVVTTARTSLNNVSVLGGAKYTFDIEQPRFAPFLLGGLELAFWNASSSVSTGVLPDAIEAEVSDTDLGIYVGGGAQYQSTPNLLLNGALTLHTAVSGYVSLRFGVTYLVGQ